MIQIICSGIKGFRGRCNRGSKMSDTKYNPLKKQVSGSHYKNYEVQPVEFCQRNRLNYCESAAIKYLCRHRDKNGIDDLRKAKHYIELLIEIEYADQNKR